MKIRTIVATLSLGSLSLASDVGIDVAGLGQSLNGWSDQRTATYTIDSQTYRTHVPTITKNINGGLFVSMRVEHLSGRRPDATAYLELTFAPNGYVGAAQIRLTMNGERYNTGQVIREPDPVIVEGQVGSLDWRSAHTKLVLELFRELDEELAEKNADEETKKRDLWGRLNGSKLERADLSAALRHNLNLLLTKTGYGFYGK